MLNTEYKLASNSQAMHGEDKEPSQPKFADYKSASASELEVPFIYFFKDAIKAGLISNLGEIEKLKTQNSVYSQYLDRWMSKAIENKVISIGSDGNFTYNDDGKSVFWGHDSETITNIISPITKTITDVAIKDTKKEVKEGISSVNFFSVYGSPAANKEYKEIINEFFKKISKLNEKSKKLEQNEDIHYVTVSTCSVNKEVLGDI